MGVEIGHESIGIVLFHVPDTGFVPAALEHLPCAYHRRDTGGVGNRL